MNFYFCKPARLVVIAIFLSLMISPASADYIAGEEANKKGDRITAFKEFHAAALNKDNRAYGKLGSMYLYGLGTEKNYQQAYIWFHMAYLSGEGSGERFRNAASSMLTRDEYLSAKKSAEALLIKHNVGKQPVQ